MSDTIAAVATGGSVSAIGIVRVSGPLSAPLMDALFRPAYFNSFLFFFYFYFFYFNLLDEKGRTLDLCLCTLSRAPRSGGARARPSCCGRRSERCSGSARGRGRPESGPSAPF